MKLLPGSVIKPDGQLGNTRKVIEHDKKFLDFSIDGDSGLPELEDAKKRLSGLK